MQIQKSNPKIIKTLSPKIELKINEQEIEKKLLNKFDFLRQEEGLHKNYSSFDFRIEERFMIDNWEKIIDFLLNDIFHNCGVTMSDLKKYTIIKNRIPTGLNNIIQQLRIEQKYVTNKDLKDENFYKINYPELYPQETGYISNFLNGVKSFMNFAGGKMGCKEENDVNESEVKIRTDISDEEKYSEIPENSIIFNFDKFKNYCNKVLEILIEILHEKDEDEVIPKNDFLKIINERYLEKKGQANERITLPYGTQNIDYAFYFLNKLKKINLFEIESNNKKVECIKLLKDQNDIITDKDKAVAKILIQIELLQKRTDEFSKKIEDLEMQAKNQLKSGNKQSAKLALIKKKNYEKYLSTTQASQNVLEDQIFNLRNAQSNVNVTNVLKQCVEAEKQIGLNPDDFYEVTEDLKEQKDNLNEVNTGMKELVDEKEDEELNKEMEKLEIENKKELDLPNANKEQLKENKELTGLDN